jgi:hypothetical protein
VLKCALMAFVSKTLIFILDLECLDEPAGIILSAFYAFGYVGSFFKVQLVNLVILLFSLCLYMELAFQIKQVIIPKI